MIVFRDSTFNIWLYYQFGKNHLTSVQRDLKNRVSFGRLVKNTFTFAHRTFLKILHNPESLLDVTLIHCVNVRNAYHVPADISVKRLCSNGNHATGNPCLCGEVVAIDGKALRGSKDGEKGPIYMVSAWAKANGIVLGQMKVHEKTNEIKAIPELLKFLAIEGCIVTTDAMGCQKDITKEIIAKQADYVLALKENHLLLSQEVEQFFADCKKEGFDDVSYEYHEEYSKGHGRIEKRKYWITEKIDWMTVKEE